MSESQRTTGTEWQWIRSEVIIRDGYECQECGALGGRKGETTLHVHHIEQVKDGGSDDADNLLTLCDECHVTEHSSSDLPDSGTCPTPVSEAYKNRDAESGEYTTVYRDDMFTDAVADGELTTREVAETVGCSYQTAYQYLRRLSNDGAIESRKVGNTRLWSLSGGETE